MDSSARIQMRMAAGLDEGEVCPRVVVAGGGRPTLPDLVEEPLDEVARAMQRRDWEEPDY